MAVASILIVVGKWVLGAGGLVVLYKAGDWLLKRDDARARAWVDWAATRGWTLHPTWPEMTSEFTGGPFGQGRKKTAERGFEGTVDGRPTFGFTYGHTTGLPHDEARAIHLVCGVRFPEARFPGVWISPETSTAVLSRGRDQQFENRAFNERWHVQSTSDRFSHALLHPRTMECLMGEVSLFDALWLEGDAVLVSLPWRDIVEGMAPSPGEADDLLELLTRFIGLLPSHLLRDVGATPTP